MSNVRPNRIDQPDLDVALPLRGNLPTSAAAGGRFPWENQLASSPIDVTLIVPCYNEEGNVIATLETIVAAMLRLPYSYEVIVLDDCSTDRTVAKVQEYQLRHPNAPVRLYRNPINVGLARNFFD